MTLLSAPAPPTTRGAFVTRRRLVGAVGALAVLGATMAATGVGTGAGPISEGGAGRGILREAPFTFSTGFQIENNGWFDVHIESIRPIPRGNAATGMPSREISLTLETHPVGVSEGSGETEMPRASRHPAKGFVVPPSNDSAGSGAFGVATWEIVENGPWHYDGYEVVYRHGLIRHRTVLQEAVGGCPPLYAETCGSSD